MAAKSRYQQDSRALPAAQNLRARLYRFGILPFPHGADYDG